MWQVLKSDLVSSGGPLLHIAASRVCVLCTFCVGIVDFFHEKLSHTNFQEYSVNTYRRSF